MWYYQGTPIENIDQLPNYEKLFGFCYKITNHKTGVIYIGKKQFHNKIRRKLTKNELSLDKRKKTYKTIVKETDWRNYYGSCKQLLLDIQELGPDLFRREIIGLAFSKKHLSYLEIKFQFQYDVLSDNSYNANILGRFYTKDVIKEL